MVSETILGQRIDAVNHKSMAELREQFQELFGFDCGNTTVRRLRRRIIYRLQEINYGGLSDADMERLNAIADKDPLANLQYGKKKRAAKVAGTRLIRIWKGKEYSVSVSPQGKYLYDGHAYKSLSAVARAITGTRWNGKLFFGVKS